MPIQSDIVTLLDEALDQTARLRKGGIQAVYYCKCGHHKRKLEVLLEAPFIFNCWVCHTSGNLYSLLKFFQVHNSFYGRLHKLIGGLSFVKKVESINELTLPEGFHPLSIYKNTPEFKNAKAYLKRRNVLEEDIIRYNIGYSEIGEYENYIIVPSYDVDNKLNFFIGRKYYDIDGIIPYKKPYHDMNIVGFENLLDYSEDINLCEGVFDAFSIRNNVCPLFGKYPSKKLRERIIINKVKRINMILDNDAYNDAIKNYRRLKNDMPNVNICIVKLDGKDPSVLGFKKTHNLIKTSNIFDERQMLRYELERI